MHAGAMPEASHDARPHVAHFILGLGMGGDAKQCLSLARVQSRWGRVSIATIDATGGPRASQVGPDIGLATGLREPAQLVEWIDAQGVDVVLFNRSGVTNPLETAFARAIAGRVGVFEYNSFGRHDPETDGVWTGQLHTCRATLVQHARRRGLNPLAMIDHLAAGLALDDVPGIDEAERADARTKLGIPKDVLVGVRLVRPDLRKWDGSPVLAARRANALGTRAHLLIREVPGARVAWTRRQLGDRATLLPMTADPQAVRETLAVGDCIVNYSSIGETFGLALAEGMASGLPALVNSTPDVDNAQVELCEDGASGIVANGVRALTEAFVRLNSRPDERARMGAEARRSILARFNAEVVERRIRRFVIDRLRATNRAPWSKFPDPGEIHDGYALDDAWLRAHARAEAIGRSSRTAVDLVDELHLRALRIVDGARYARHIGPGQVARVLASRLRSGSLKRG
jgi:hypothetical protein